MKFSGAVSTGLYFSVGISLSSSKKGSKTWCSESGMSFVGTSLSTRKSLLSVAGVFFDVTFLSACEVSLELEKFSFFLLWN